MSALAIEPRSRAPAQPVRRYELDWLRALAVFGLIPFHVAIIFSLGQKDYVSNAQRSEVLDLLAVFVTFWGIPLLFVVAGASAWFSLRSHTSRQYLQERVGRLLIPLLFGMLTVVPIQVYFGRLGDPSFHQSFPEFYAGYFLAFAPDNLPMYLAHLWFIPMLLAFSVLTLPLFAHLRGDAGRRLVARLAALCERPGVILLFGLPLGIVEVVLNARPVTTLLTTYLLYSNWALFVFFLIFFVYGYALYADDRFARAIRRHTLIAIGLGVACWIVAQALLTPYLRQDSTQASYDLTVTFVVAMFLRGFISWFWIMGIVGLAMRWLTFTNGLLGYLNDAFYPAYVLHMTVLTIVGFYVVRLPTDVAVKYVLIVALTLLITLAIYDIAIRRNNVARYLFGLKAAGSSQPVDAHAGGRLQSAGGASVVGGEHTLRGPRLLRVREGKTMSEKQSGYSRKPLERHPTISAEPSPMRVDPAEVNLAQLFRNRSAQYATTLRWRQRGDDGWRTATYAENQRIVNRLIAGLAALGARPGDVIGILANTRWEWMAADWATLGLGCVTTMIYAASLPTTVGVILRDSGTRFLFVENRAQYDKLTQFDDEEGQLRALIMIEDADTVADDPRVISFDALQQLSPLTDEQADALAAERAANIQADDIASIVYTSGTTGVPKGAVHTHHSHLAQLIAVRVMLPTVHAGMRDTLFLPLSHVLGRLEHFFTFDRGAETVLSSPDTLARDLREWSPDLLLAAPRVYEKAYAAIRDAMYSGSPVRRRIARWAESVGRTTLAHRERGEPAPLLLRMEHAAADWLVLRHVRAGLGGRLQFAISGSAPIDVEILRFFFAVGVPLLEGWGLTETGGAYTVNMLDHYRIGTVGPAFPGHEIRIAQDGEVLLYGPCLFREYWHNPTATGEAFDEDGWFRTGDIGSLAEDGFLRIVDRKKELIATSGGKKIAPQYVEHLLQTIPEVSQACVYGDRKPYLVALLTMDADAVAKWAARREIAGSETSAVWQLPAFRAYLAQQVAAVNTQLASYEQVKYFDVLDDEFTVENGLATPTLKIRRRQIVARYHDRFEALYQPTPARWDSLDKPAAS